MLKRSLLVVALSAVSASTFAQDLPRQPAPAGASLYFIEPTDGATVASPVTIKFGLKGMGVAPSGVQKENTGHHHVLLDVERLPPMNLPVPNDEHHVHFGGGQTETSLALPPGTHTLQLILGDHLHIPHNPPLLSQKITITVK
jgi:hypothetical protein